MDFSILLKVEPYTPVLLLIIALYIITQGLPLSKRFISRDAKKGFASKVDDLLYRYLDLQFVDLFRSHIKKKGRIYFLSYWFSAFVLYIIINFLIALFGGFPINRELPVAVHGYYMNIMVVCVWSAIVSGPPKGKGNDKPLSLKKILNLRQLLKFVLSAFFLIMGTVYVYALLTYYQNGNLLYSAEQFHDYKINFLAELVQFFKTPEGQINYLLFLALLLIWGATLIFSMLVISSTYFFIAIYASIQYSVRQRLARIGSVIGENDPYYLDTIIGVIVFLLAAIAVILTFRYSYY